jgi:RimJ/RimL family protein N-acetyltransferase
MTKELLWYAFYYPFVECGCKRVTGLVEEGNAAAREFDERLGFHLEAKLKDAAPEGDLLVYAMFRDECRWLKLRERIPHINRQVN